MASSSRGSDGVATRTCVHTSRPFVDKRQYDLAIYHENERFHAVWWCPECLLMVETPRVQSELEAEYAGITLLEAHHDAAHGRQSSEVSSKQA